MFVVNFVLNRVTKRTNACIKYYYYIILNISGYTLVPLILRCQTTALPPSHLSLLPQGCQVSSYHGRVVLAQVLEMS